MADDRAGDGSSEAGDEADPATRERIESDPFCEVLGIELRELRSGFARTALVVADEHLNFHGTPHGGAVYSVADAAFAAASNADGPTALALETNLSYFEAAPVGQELTATAERVHRRGRTAGYRVEVTDGDGEPVASFRGRVYLPD